MKRALILSLLLAGSLSVQAASMEIRRFDDPARQERYETLIKELRCLVCQNQALSDSDADLAKDLRDEVYRIIQSGKTDQEAVDFLVQRYGDFVLYRPPFKPLTLLLWGGPLLLSLIGGTLLWRQWRGHREENDAAPLSAAEQEKLQRLHASTDADNDPS